MEKTALQNILKSYFVWFHRHPELGFEEHQTTARIRELLGQAGVEILDSSLKTGLVARIRGRPEGPVAALRADIDALPITEETGLDYASEHPGRMHACGHDFHLTALLGAALLLREKKAALAGTVKLLFQPAEEGTGGARIAEPDKKRPRPQEDGGQDPAYYPESTGSRKLALSRYRLLSYCGTVPEKSKAKNSPFCKKIR